MKQQLKNPMSKACIITEKSTKNKHNPILNASVQQLYKQFDHTLCADQREYSLKLTGK